MADRQAARRKERIRTVLADRAGDALFGISEALPKLVELDVDAISPNPDQPRKRMADTELQELAGSIEQHGLLQPIIVKAAGDAYLLVAGQRRLEAFRRLGLTRIPALLTTGRADELALIENLQRSDLDPLDEAEALAALKERYGYTHDQLARAMAKAKSTVSELLSLNGLPDAIKAEVRTSERATSKSLLIEIARLEGEAARLSLWRKLHGNAATTVREIRSRKREADEGRADPPADAVRALGEQLLKRLGGIGPETLDRQPRLSGTLQRLRRRIDAILGDRA